MNKRDRGGRRQVDTSVDTTRGEIADWQRPPFEPGHTLSLRHGAYSERAIAARAEAVHAELLTFAPYLDEPRFLPAVQRYLDAAARELLLHEHVERLSAEKGTGAVPARVWEQATAAARLAAKLGSDLGLDPIGHARIRALSAASGASEASQSLAELTEQGRRIRLAAERRTAIDASAEDDDDDDVVSVEPTPRRRRAKGKR
jgi:hypothetical protein